MPITHNRVKIKKHPQGQERNYISYFQSVTTLGIVSRAANSDEASEKAKCKIVNNGFTCGVINQTPMELSATEEWQPHSNAIPFLEDRKDSVIVNLNKKSRQLIANRMGIPVDKLTDRDCQVWIDMIVQDEENSFSQSS